MMKGYEEFTVGFNFLTKLSLQPIMDTVSRGLRESAVTKIDGFHQGPPCTAEKAGLGVAGHRVSKCGSIV